MAEWIAQGVRNYPQNEAVFEVRCIGPVDNQEQALAQAQAALKLWPDWSWSVCVLAPPLPIEDEDKK